MNINKIRDILCAQDDKFILVALLIPPNGMSRPLGLDHWISDTVVVFKKLDTFSETFVADLATARLADSTLKFPSDDWIMLVNAKNLCSLRN